MDLYYLGRMVKPGGVVMLDDSNLPGVARAASFFVADVGWRIAAVGTSGTTSVGGLADVDGPGKAVTLK